MSALQTDTMITVTLITAVSGWGLAFIQFLTDRRKSSGHVETSDAEIIFKAQSEYASWVREDLDKRQERIDQTEENYRKCRETTFILEQRLRELELTAARNALNESRENKP